VTVPVLQPFGPQIWIADGPVVAVAGFRYPTRMAVIRLSDGSLFIWSPVSLTPALQAAVEAQGRVSDIVAPNSLHHLHLAAWKQAFPHARLHAAPGLRGKRTDLAFDADLGDAADPVWAGQVDQVPVHGNLITTEVVFFHRESGTVLFTDLVQNFPPGWFSGWRAVIAWLDRMRGEKPQVLQKFRVAFVNRAAARQALRQIQAWPCRNVLMAHGNPVVGGGVAFIREAFGWLRP
jgi:hypothetical protein